MLPGKNWKTMDKAPKDGTAIVVKYKEWGKKNGPERMQAAQWLCNENGDEWTWRKPHHFGTAVHADAWMTFGELAAQCVAKAAAALDFDL